MENWLFAVPIIGAIAVWGGKEYFRYQWRVRQYKEKHYRKLIDSFKGFLAGSADETQIDTFITELRLSTLHCPDTVIKSGIEFLRAVSTEQKEDAPEDLKQERLAQLIRDIREDMNQETWCKLLCQKTKKLCCRKVVVLEDKDIAKLFTFSPTKK